MLTRREEEYLVAIRDIEAREGQARVVRIAERLEVKPPTVVGMLKHLAEEGLVEYQLYCSIKLTPYGMQMAGSAAERHEVYEKVFELMGVPKDLAAEEAFKFERVLTAESAQKMSSLFRNLLQSEKGRKMILEMTQMDAEEMKSGVKRR